MKGKHVLFFMLLFFFLCLPSSYATPTFEQIFNDLKPFSARVIVEQGAFYLNVGQNKGIKPGEWWRIYREGPRIVDPVTGKVLGAKENPVAVAQVVKVFDNFSELKVFCLKPGCAVANATLAKRFDGFKSYFYDLSGKGLPFYERLKAGLINLSWEPYQQVSSRKAISQPSQALVFVADKNFLYVYSDGHTLGVYALGSLRPTYAPAYNRYAKPYQLVGRLGEIVYHLEVQRFGPYFYIASLTKKAIELQRLRGPEHYTYKYKGFGDLIHFSVGKDGLIALNIFDGKKVISRIIRFSNGNFYRVTKDSSYILRFFDFDGDGIKETLLGQNFDNEDFFGTGVFILKIDGERLKKLSSLKVPRNFQIFGSFFADLNRDGKREVGFFNPGRKLVLYQERKRLWTSNVKFGGGIQYVYLDQPEPEIQTPNKIMIWPNPEIVNWQGWPRVFLPFNEYDILGGLFSGPKRSTIAVLYLTREGYQLFFWRHTFPGAVQAVFSNGKEIYFVVVSGDFFKGEGQTKIYKVPIPQFMQELNY
ncbi:FG-GAP repeat domain-containing protein [Thermodesulfatator atlanticus]|uniref:FG-GAP repeat domain-containing protein n=1 Tax=Thermodesulfatator atlanticus TaxID=501497 RepID=UPI0003B470CC|nr:VCBS repeat-containing protein [Thermodesulfatator atlanticus]